MSDITTIEFDIDRYAFDIGKNAARRASLLLGFGHNSIKHLKPEDVAPPSENLFNIVILRKPEEASLFEHYKEQFLEMIIRASIREFIETWAVFLDKVYTLCLVCLKEKGILKIIESNGAIILKAAKYGTLKGEPTFQELGLEKKINYLKEKFNVFSGYDSMFTQTAILRNCYAHYAGRMPEKYIQNQDSFSYEWLGLDASLIDSLTGDIIDIKDQKEPIFCKNGASAQFTVKTRFVEFPLNSICRLSATQIQEILFIADLALQQLRTHFIEFKDNITT